MSEIDTETDTETEVEDRFAHLFKVLPHRRAKLFSKDNIALAVELRLRSLAMFVKLVVQLRANGVGKLREYEAEIDKAVKVVERAARSKAVAGDDEPKDTPLTLARRFRDEQHPTLLWHQGDWLLHRGSYYAVVEPDAVRRDVYAFIEQIGGYPSSKTVGEVVDALKGVALVERGFYSPPCWLADDDREVEYPAKDILSCRNGLLHLPSGTVLDQTPSFFTRNGLSYDYDPAAPRPAAWLKFLDDVWGHDPEQITLLQEIFGYLLTPDTSRQKFFLLLGVTRGGKGTIIRTLSRLLGTTSICSPTLASLGSRFGLETTMGKSLATVSDMRLGSRTDKQEIVQNILRIVGEDDVDIERKHVGGAVTGKHNIRILIAGNKAPTLPDESGAFVARLIALRLTNSFLGKEDEMLAEKLAGEMAGILNWSIEGWRRLQAQGGFTSTAASKEVVERISEVAAPLNTFLRECCELDPTAKEPKDRIWQAYLAFTADHQMPAVYSSSTHFQMSLESAAQFRISTGRPRVDGKQVPHWMGLRLKPEWEERLKQWAADVP